MTETKFILFLKDLAESEHVSLSDVFEQLCDSTDFFMDERRVLNWLTDILKKMGHPVRPMELETANKLLNRLESRWKNMNRND